MEHVAQSNQYFLVTGSISLRNKPSLIRHMENHKQTLTNSAQWAEVCTGCHSICLCKHSCLMTFIIVLLFGTSLLLLAASTSSLSFPPHITCAAIAVMLLLWYFSLLHPRSNLACEIAPFSSTPLTESAPLRFPVWVAAITLVLSLVRDLGGQHRLQSIVMEMTQIYHHGDNLWTVLHHTHPKDSADSLLLVHVH